jgi:sulfoxide reductase catalytic subunit YedY
MLIKRAPDIRSSEITDRELYLNRRQLIARATVALAGVAAPSLSSPPHAYSAQKLPVSKRSGLSTDEELTSYSDAVNYNNFYEFSTRKGNVARLARGLRTRPWTVTVEGLIKKPGVYDIDELIKLFPLEERIYRLRCVEAWSMVIPWVGFPLADFIKRCEPASGAGFVEFTTLYDPAQMPRQRTRGFNWPYVEGLRMDEALHPLAMLALGMYGEVMPNQNGAPLRLVVPWKYGFKSIKSIVRIRFLKDMPLTAWARALPHEYGFYANVNPSVDHPRWSQKRERRIGDFFKRDTLMFNGYADQVAHLYRGMDLRSFF